MLILWGLVTEMVSQKKSRLAFWFFVWLVVGLVLVGFFGFFGCFFFFF